MRKRHTIKKYKKRQARTKRKAVTRRRRRKYFKKRIQRGGNYNESEIKFLKEECGFNDEQLKKLNKVEKYLKIDLFKTIFNDTVRRGNPTIKQSKIESTMILVNNLIKEGLNTPEQETDFEESDTDDDSFASDDE